MSFTIPAGQVSILFLLIGLGWLAFRVGWLKQDVIPGLTKVLIYAVSPAVIVRAFQRPFELARLQQVGLVFVVDLAVIALSIGIARVLFSNDRVRDQGRRAVFRFGTVYTNAGFIGLPLAQALLGDEGVTYTAAFMAAFTVFVWTHGDALFAGTRSPGVWRRIVRVVVNPGIIGSVVGVLLFGFSLRLPFPLAELTADLSALNAPLSMLVIGGNLAALELRRVIADAGAWTVTLARNVLVPLVFIGLLAPLPLEPAAKLATMIALSAPTGAFLVMFSVLHDREVALATRVMCVSTLASLLTLPAVLGLASVVW